MITITYIKYCIRSRIWVIILSAMNFVCPLLLLFFCFVFWFTFVWDPILGFGGENPAFWAAWPFLGNFHGFFLWLRTWKLNNPNYFFHVLECGWIFEQWKKSWQHWNTKIKILTLRRLWAALVGKRFGVSWVWICAHGC